MRKQSFSAFLKTQLEESRQVGLAKAIGVSETAVSRWVNDESFPDFENCMRIAKYFNLSPVHLFEMLERPEAVELYNWFLPEYVPKDLSLEFVYQDSEIRNLHDMLDDMIAAANGEKPDINVTSLVSSLLMRISDLAKT